MTETADAAPVGPYGQTAARYWSAGWQGALPLPPRKKANPPDGWTGHKNPEFPSWADIDAWVQVHADGNIGLRLPRHVVGIDVDNYGDKQGRAHLNERIAKWGELPPTWVTSSRYDTGSGIALYLVPEGRQWPGKVSDAIEVIQFGHRYAVVWPSIHPEGRVYRWYHPNGTVVLDTIPAIDELPWLPEAWLQGLTAGQQHEDLPLAGLVGDDVNQWLAVRQHDGPCERMQKAIDSRSIDLAVPGASRHDTAVAAMMYVVRLMGEGHHGGITALGKLKAVFDRVAASDPKRTPDPAEWNRMLLGAVDRVAAMTTIDVDPCEDARKFKEPFPTLQQPVGVDPLTRDQILLNSEIDRQRAQRGARRALDEEEESKHFREPVWVRTLTDELALPDNPVPFVVAEVMPAGANVLLTAQFKAGKTTLVNNLTQSLVDGVPFLGQYAIKGDHRVGIFNYEVTRDQYRRWLREAGIENTDRVTVLNLRGYRMPMITQRVEDWMVTWLADHGITAWVLDPFARAYVGSGETENDNTTVGRFLDTVDIIKERAGVRELVLPTHTGRAIQEAGQERARGATRLDDWADVRWLLSKDDEDKRYFRAIGRDVETEELGLGFNPSTRRIFVEGSGRKKAAKTDLNAEILNHIRNNPGCTGNDVDKAVTGGRPKKLAALKTLKETGRLRTEQGFRLYVVDRPEPGSEFPTLNGVVPGVVPEGGSGGSGPVPASGSRANVVSPNHGGSEDDDDEGPSPTSLNLDREQFVARQVAYREAEEAGLHPRIEQSGQLVDRDSGEVIWSP